jgi:hypothetical protein
VGWGTRVLNLRSRNLHYLGRHAEELTVARRMRGVEQGEGWVRLPELRALAALGRAGELDLRVDAAMTLDASEVTWEPFSPGDMLMNVARELAAHGDTAGASRYLRRAEEWYRSRPPGPDASSSPLDRRGLARVLYTAGRWREAGELYEVLHAADTTNLEDFASLGLLAAHSGDTSLAHRVIGDLSNDRRPWRFGAPAIWAARIAAALGRREEAVTLLRRGVSEGHSRMHLMHTDPYLMGLAGFAPMREFLAPRH